jgi:hypothetical protein
MATGGQVTTMGAVSSLASAQVLVVDGIPRDELENAAGLARVAPGDRSQETVPTHVRRMRVRAGPDRFEMRRQQCRGGLVDLLVVRQRLGSSAVVASVKLAVKAYARS